jgi:hypothetical protein
MNNNAQKLFYVLRPHDLLVAYGHAMPICLTATPTSRLREVFLAAGTQGCSVPISGGGPPG